MKLKVKKDKSVNKAIGISEIKEYLNDENVDSFFPRYAEIMEKYNNNYRTIYHLERFIVYVRNLKTTTQE